MIEGGRPLSGAIACQGAKNAALPMMAAALLTDEPVTLAGVPDLADVRTMVTILESLGVQAVREGSTLTLRTVDARPFTAPYELVSTMRASFCVLGPLLARRRRAEVALPGGCVIGVRPVDLHVKGLAQLGAGLTVERGFVVGHAPALHGARVYLGGAFGSTVTGTANVLMAATLAKGTTIIENAACEPEIEELGRMLQAMGAKIEGVGTHRLIINGVGGLKGAMWNVIPDRIEAGTFMAAAAITGGDVTVTNVRPDHLTAVFEVMREMGIRLEILESSVRVTSNGMFHPVEITTLPYPGFPTDVQAQFMAILTVADGISVVTEKIYPDRFMHVAEFGRMGARIRKEGPMAIVHGVRELRGAPVMASDIRASAGLVVAGLRAVDPTEIQRVYHIDRGYEKIEERLTGIGARIQRVGEEKKKARTRWAAAL